MEFLKVCPQFSGSDYLSIKSVTGDTSVLDVVVMVKSVDRLQGAADVVFLGFVVKIANSWMIQVICAEDLFGFVDFVWFVDILN